MSTELTLRRSETAGVHPIARCASAAVAMVGEEMAVLSGHHGRAGMIICLRQRSRDLCRSAFAEDQVRSRAFEAAADDLAWGRAPLQDWLREMSDPSAASEAQRAAIRASLPGSGRDITTPAEGLLREVEARWTRGETGALDELGRRGDYFDAVRALQALAFDDPRLDAPPALRAVMRCSADLLAEAVRSAAAGSGAAVVVGPGRPRGFWRRLLRWRLWLGRGSGPQDRNCGARRGDL